jgi:hypothetical protein
MRSLEVYLREPFRLVWICRDATLWRGLCLLDRLRTGAGDFGRGSKDLAALHNELDEVERISRSERVHGKVAVKFAMVFGRRTHGFRSGARAIAPLFFKLRKQPVFMQVRAATPLRSRTA